MQRLSLLLVLGLASVFAMGLVAGCGGDNDDETADVADVADVGDVGEDTTLVEDGAAEEVAVPVDVSGVEVAFPTKFSLDRSIDSLSEMEQRMLCREISAYMMRRVDGAAIMETVCFDVALQQATFLVTDGDVAELQRVCSVTFDACFAESSPPTPTPFGGDADSCTWIGPGCDAPIRLVAECYAGYVTYFNQLYGDTPTCDDLAVDSLGQVQVPDGLTPDVEPVMACAELGIRCPGL